MSRRGCILFVVVFGCIACVGLAVAAYFLAEQERKQVIEDYGETIAEMCNPPAGGVADAANLPEGSNLKALVLIDGDTRKHAFHSDLPTELRAEDQASVGLVVCVKPRDIEVENCEYFENESDTTAMFNILRIQKVQDVVLLNAVTGNRVAQITVEGAMPEECKDQASGSKGSTTKINGADVTYNQFEIAVKPYLTGAQ